MEVQGWGRFPTASAEVLEPIDADSLKKMVSANKKTGSMIPRGAGRSYGDSSLADQLISSRFLDSFLSIDENKLSLRCGAGVSLDQILKLCIPRGWFLPVLPGTKFVSVGGAIAADIHGKNHHLDGSFCDHVLSLSLMLASGEVLVCSRDFNSDLFHATCGGMGLTGMIVDATVKLDKVSGVFIKRQLLIANNLQHCFEVLENNHDSKYSVAWLDCLASGEELGRSVVYLGEHADKGEPRYQSRGGANIPFSTPAFLLNKITMRIFTSTYFKLKQKGQQESDVNYDTYFFPLDNIGHWNRLYGSKGFLQYQFVIPEESAFAAINMILSKVSVAGKGSFLSVLKKFGKANSNLLSFPLAGYTLTLDFKNEKSLFPLLDELDEIVVAHGGRIYLAKDARMSEAVFKAGYPNWEKFVETKQKYDPSNVFRSRQSDRLGIS